MPTAQLYRYQPAIVPGPHGHDPRLLGPDGEDYHDTLTELCELDGWRYVAVPAGITPQIPAALTTWEAVDLSPALREAVKAASPHCQLAKERFVLIIRAKHSLDDELYYARIATGSLLGTYSLQDGEAAQLAIYQNDVESARQRLHEQYAQLGL